MCTGDGVGRTTRFVGLFAAGALGLAALLALGAFLLLRFTGPATIEESVYRPLPVGIDETFVHETGCNLAGPEPAYLVHHSVVIVDDQLGDPVEAIRGHLEAEGWRLSDDVGFQRWATFTGRHDDTTVAVGPAADLAGWDYAGDPSTIVARQLDGGTVGEPAVGSGELPRAVVMRFDLVGDWDSC